MESIVNSKQKCENCMALGHSILEVLCSQNRTFLDNVKHCITYKSEANLLTQGSLVRGVFCVNSGKIKIYKSSESGKEQIIRFAKKGDLLGYRTLIAGHKLGVSATTIENTSVCFIEREDFYRMMKKEPQLKERLMEELSEDLLEMVDGLTNMAQRSARSRLCGALLVLMELYGDEPINLSRENLANFVGTAQESVIRLLSELRMEGLIEIKGRKISILNQKSISKIAQFN
ncbi:MAG: Crp/Fnr family transcriptional regulator [Flavobacteriales bacterium]|nr:Crp/Fnr family transcriptional regulator [Flavobacteriales bacterium]